jgi:hypothetical protein
MKSDTITMTRRQFLPVTIGIKHSRIFIDDIINVHRRVKKIRPSIPKYYDEVHHSKS